MTSADSLRVPGTARIARPTPGLDRHRRALRATLHSLTLVAASLALSALFSLYARAAEDPPAATKAEPAISFHRQVRPILAASCQGCHQPAKAGGKILLTRYADLFEGGRSKKGVVVAGKPGESLIIEAITPQGTDRPEMPKDATPLDGASVEIIRRWIAEGAADDTPESVRQIVSADQPPVYTTLPVLTAIDHSPDGQLLAVSGYHEVLLHAADGSGLQARLIGEAERIEAVAFSPDGKLLAVAGGVPCSFGEVQLWDVAERKLKVSVPATQDNVYGASWSPDGSVLAFGCGDNTVRAIDPTTGKEVLFQGAHDDWVLDTVFSVDGSHLITASRDRSLKLIQVKTQQFIDNITSITPGALRGGLSAVDRHPTKDEVLVGGADSVPKIYQIYRTKARQIGDDFNLIRKLEPVAGRILAVEYSRDGTRAVVGASEGSASGSVHVYTTEDGKHVSFWSGKTGIYAVSFSPDGGTVAAGGFDGILRILDANTAKVLREVIPVPLADAQKRF